MSNYKDWVSVVTDDDKTPIWSGPRANAEAWLESDQGKAYAKALSFRGVKLIIEEDKA